uniref:Uncharacterized protein n=1 Tax=Arundo donax TaxID=35708 RepID=A0A0A9FLW4_ARUDO
MVESRASFACFLISWTNSGPALHLCFKSNSSCA